jgi:hypothetical protein
MREHFGAAMALLFTLLLATQGPARAADQSPEAFLHSIYDHYIGDKARGVPFDTNADIRRYFAPALAKLIIDDRKAAKGEVSALDGDAFVDAQDWQIASIDIKVEPAAQDKALGVVSFTNLDKPETIKLQLVKLKGGWKIDDIAWPEGTLRGLYKK